MEEASNTTTAQITKTDVYVTQEELKELKTKVNKSMEQLVKLVLKTKRQIEAIEERIAIYNTRGGHKI